MTAPLDGATMTASYPLSDAFRERLGGALRVLDVRGVHLDAERGDLENQTTPLPESS